ncbi:DoxX family protein [Mycetocola reblochoni]|uniref:DoxX family protein n=2 Tax=Mycetocola reblochoni TaxID=331618 RepID=A0A1R4J8E3_9MICO|nr:DoxX family protein [Mycetocola reblochoni]RLP70120.1 DoxX family protein [Mycetocola reblochoni]SJN28302.1 hypothetical protein FM119_05940 [Mycetocola reblochoni REB411]
MSSSGHATSPGHATSAGLLLLRLALAGVMLAHGLQKLFTWGVPGTQESFAAMGVPAAETAAIVVIAIETVGAVLLVLGLGTRVVGVLAAINMAVAVVLVHLAAGFFVADGGYEFALLLAVLGVVVALTGPGRYSLDAVISARRR